MKLVKSEDRLDHEHTKKFTLEITTHNLRPGKLKFDQQEPYRNEPMLRSFEKLCISCPTNGTNSDFRNQTR